MDQELKKWNQLATQQDEIYHLCAKRSGLPDAQFWLLYAICETEDALCQNAFCESWCYSKQTASAAVAALEKAGLVYLTYAEGSRKQKELHLTEKGQQFCDKHIRSVQTVEGQVLKKLSERDRDDFFRIYAKILFTLEQELNV